MTEDEARKKWCPFARAITDAPDATPAAGNRLWAVDTNEMGIEPARCIASDCMAWRWVDEDYEVVRTRNLTDDFETMQKRIKTHPTEQAAWKRPEGEPLPPPGEGWQKDGQMKQAQNALAGVFEQRWRRRKSQNGRCGLAGNPS